MLYLQTLYHAGTKFAVVYVFTTQSGVQGLHIRVRDR